MRVWLTCRCSGPGRSLEELHSREVEANAGLLAALEERKVGQCSGSAACR